MAGRFLVVGIGNPQRGDDGAGRAVVAWLRGRLPEAVELAVQDGNAVGLFDGFAGAAAIWLVDACVSGRAPGTLQRFDAVAAPLPEALRSCSTHGLGPAQAIELARALGQLPGRCRVHVIEGAEFAPGAGLSPAVAAAVPDVGQGVVLRQDGDGRTALLPSGGEQRRVEVPRGPGHAVATVGHERVDRCGAVVLLVAQLRVGVDVVGQRDQVIGHRLDRGAGGVGHLGRCPGVGRGDRGEALRVLRDREDLLQVGAVVGRGRAVVVGAVFVAHDRKPYPPGGVRPRPHAGTGDHALGGSPAAGAPR